MALFPRLSETIQMIHLALCIAPNMCSIDRFFVLSIRDRLQVPACPAPPVGSLRPTRARCMLGVAVLANQAPPCLSLWEEVGEPPCRPLNFAAKSARGGRRPRPPQDATPRHPGNRLSAATDWAGPQGAGGGRDSAAAAGARACQSGRSTAACRTAGPTAPRRGCAR